MSKGIWGEAFTVAGSFMMTLGLAVAAGSAAQAQTFNLLYSFTQSGTAGYIPYAGVTLDRSGNLYGTTNNGGVGYGAVYKLTERNGSWTISPLYNFSGGIDGAFPESRVVFGPDGALYGTTLAGGSDGCNGQGCGTVFRLTPSPAICRTVLCPWVKTVLYRFQGGADGSMPSYGDLTFDQSRAVYGTTGQGGSYGFGAVYKVTHTGGNWIESVIYSFTGADDGFNPQGGVTFDQGGNLYGTSEVTVFELSPASGGWVFNLLHIFQPFIDGFASESGLLIDGAGNLYGDTHTLGPGQGGTLYEGTPSGDSFTFQVVYPFQGGTGSVGSAPIMDAAGNLYGARVASGAGEGEAFKLAPENGSWTYVQVHQFMGGRDDGAYPYGSVAMDASGNLYGTASSGGAHGYGVVYEITP